MNQIVILGGGGHASDVLSVIESLESSAVEWPVIVVDEGTPNLDRYKDRSVVVVNSFTAAEELADSLPDFVSGVGYPKPRRSLIDRARSLNWRAADPLIHPTAVLNANVTVGAGAVVMGLSWLSPSTAIGEHVYVGYGAKLGHDCVIGAYVSLLPGCFIGGDAQVEEGCLIGANATVLPGVTIGTGSQVGAGAVVVKDVEPDITVTGVPAVETQKEWQ